MSNPLMRPGRHLSQQHLAPVHAPNAALLIDFDNVTLGIRSDLTKELKTLLNSDIIKGKVAVQRAYADWRRYPQYIVSLSEASIDLIFAPAFGSNKKNATDIRLAVDAIELVFTRPEIGTFILLSGDSDFSSMVLKLKEYGKYVIGVGIRESASDLLIQNCDEYYSYNDLAGLSKEQETAGPSRDPWELAREAVAQMARNGDVMRSDRLKQVMQQLDANFDERDLGFSRFSKFVLEAAGKGLILATKLENGQFEVAPLAVAAAAPAAPEPREPREGREDREEGRRGRRRGRGRERGAERGGERGERTDRPERAETGGRAEAPPRAVQTPTGQLTLARAFQLMTEALTELGGSVGHEALRLRMSALLGREDALLEPGRFGRLLRQANDAEVADVRKVGEDEYEVALPRGAARMMPPAGAAPQVAAAAPPAEAAAAAGGDGGESAASVAAARVGITPAAPVPATVSAAAGGLRFRRGSRSPLRPAEIPLIGVFRADAVGALTPSAESVAEPTPSGSAIGDAETTASEGAAGVDAAAPEAPAERGRGRGGRGGSRGRAKKAASAPAEAPAAAPAPASAATAAPKEAKRAKGGAARKSAAEASRPANGGKAEAKAAAKSPKSAAKSAAKSAGSRPRAKAKG